MDAVGDPRLVIAGARRAGVKTVDVLDVKGSCERATRRMADHVVSFAVGESDKAVEWAGIGRGLSLRSRPRRVRSWLWDT